jgi:hypothetical protein
MKKLATSETVMGKIGKAIEQVIKTFLLGFSRE